MTNPHPETGRANAYGTTFYDAQLGGSLRSARIYAGLLWQFYQPASVFDFGCGHGAWLKAFAEQGSDRLVGYDGNWNTQADMLDPRIEFHPVDLDQVIWESLGDKDFDLALSLEVAEHLEPESSSKIVETLCVAAPVVIFGAAFLHQSGIRHINLRKHSFWAGLFTERDFEVFDLFRPFVWGNQAVDYWYQQNTFLYVRSGHGLGEELASQGHRPVKRLELLDCVPPDLLDQHANAPLGQLMRKQLKRQIPGWLLALLGKDHEH